MLCRARRHRRCRNGTGPAKVSTSDEVDGHLKKAHSTVGETIEHKEDKIIREVVCAVTDVRRAAALS
ncbi:hypothetical protein BD309DRAFT_975978 [Dichomitus squalens]|nr:hypothetical protein BD309DRAFT_975978 [Dichomitus squalens]